MSEIGVVTPFWLDRPDTEALDIATQADQSGFETLWVGEMVTFDAFVAATAIALRTKQIGLRVGPLAIGVRSPVAMALGLSSVARLSDRRVDIALGASSPAIVSGWHDRPWGHAAPRMRETVGALRPILGGERGSFEGQYIRTRGFRLRNPLPSPAISVAAFGPAMTKVAAEVADEVVLNLVTPAHVASVRETVDKHARNAGVAPPRIAVWVTVALDPGVASIRQMLNQIAVYFRPPGYGEMFAALGYGGLVAKARAGTPPSQLATDIPAQLLTQVCAVGSAREIADQIAKYHAAGADHVGVVPSTAEDPGGRAVLRALREATA
ncbi:LLM class F420-dependent oxidoreductase [Antrihabitans stalactiti]|uniref:LLM class F420-dependent oxidoreductase n=1 Tax=Antrihabitans stalactiti TaxID=2584121 RepID=A0A848KFF6_9NOCA|nr:LLM class F420-dependent oxidoreductase [Antrihabitans stalactiti]